MELDSCMEYSSHNHMLKETRASIHIFVPIWNSYIIHAESQFMLALGVESE